MLKRGEASLSGRAPAAVLGLWLLAFAPARLLQWFSGNQRCSLAGSVGWLVGLGLVR